MEIQQCYVCSTILYPGDKRYRVKIWIYPEGEEELCEWELPEEEEARSFLDQSSLCDRSPVETQYAQNAFGEDLGEEIHLTLCKTCQTRLLSNPSVKANLIFLNRDTLTKTTH
jgi:hypothetical protein